MTANLRNNLSPVKVSCPTHTCNRGIWRNEALPEMTTVAPGSMTPLFGRTQYLRGAVVFTLKHTLLSEGFFSLRFVVTTSVKGPGEDKPVKIRTEPKAHQSLNKTWKLIECSSESEELMLLDTKKLILCDRSGVFTMHTFLRRLAELLFCFYCPKRNPKQIRRIHWG